MSEQWVPVLGFEDRYSVSCRGRVKSHYRNDAIMSPGQNSVGYLYVCLQKDYKVRNAGVHRIVLESFTGTRGKGLEAAHVNGNRTDNRLENLKWMNHKDNNAEKILHGTHQAGEKHPCVKLTAKDVHAIRRRIARGDKMKLIGQDYPFVRLTTIYDIKNGKSWACLPTESKGE